jgi:hypothetical protein
MASIIGRLIKACSVPTFAWRRHRIRIDPRARPSVLCRTQFTFRSGPTMRSPLAARARAWRRGIKRATRPQERQGQLSQRRGRTGVELRFDPRGRNRGETGHSAAAANASSSPKADRHVNEAKQTEDLTLRDGKEGRRERAFGSRRPFSPFNDAKRRKGIAAHEVSTPPPRNNREASASQSRRKKTATGPHPQSNELHYA